MGRGDEATRPTLSTARDHSSPLALTGLTPRERASVLRRLPLLAAAMLGRGLQKIPTWFGS